MDTPTVNIISLFAGAGGLDLGVHEWARGMGIDCRVVAYVEREAPAVGILVEAMERGALDPAPIWTDVETFNGKPFRGVVDLIVAGWPCPPYSSAPRGRNVPDTMWRHVTRIVDDVEPSAVFLENVDTIGRAARYVVGDLSERGFCVRWGVFCSTTVGAQHARRRWFAVATHTDRESEPLGAVHAQMAGVREATGHRNRGGFAGTLGALDGLAD